MNQFMYDPSDSNKLSIVMRKHNKMVTTGNAGRSQCGAIAIMAAILLIPLLSFFALAIDMGYRHVVRNELQNAADAAALAGAAYLYPPIGTPLAPNFALAQTKAGNAVGLNKAANITLVTGTGVPIVTGYWNIAGKTGGVYKGVHSPPDAPIPNQVSDFPAVQVTISKAGGNDNSAVNTFFAKVFGMNSVSVSATAVAVGGLSPNSSFTEKDMFPVAITKCMFDNYWNSNTGQPTTNPPLTFNIGSSYHYSGCEAGQWTSLNLNTNNVPTIRDLIDYATGAATNPSPTQFNIGDNIWIEPGTKTTLYSSVNNCSAAGDKTCEFILMPVVCFNSPACDNLDTHTKTPIVGFACINILSATGGSTKAITAKMAPMGSAGSKSSCKVPSGGVCTTTTCTNYGISMPPRLVNYSDNTY